MRTSDAGSQYCCGRVRRGFQPPSTPQYPLPTNIHKKYLKRLSSCFWTIISTYRTNIWTDKAFYWVVCPQLNREGRKEKKLKKEIKKNKVKYTANSCGRVGCGGNARFLTFQLDHYGWTNGPTDRRRDRQMDGWTDRRMDRQTDGRTNGRTDRPTRQGVESRARD